MENTHKFVEFVSSHPWAEYLPFVSLVAGKPIGTTPIFARMVETAIMSIVAGAVGVYVGVEVIKNDLQYLKTGVSEVNTKVEKLENKVEQIRADLYIPRGKREC